MKYKIEIYLKLFRYYKINKMKIILKRILIKRI